MGAGDEAFGRESAPRAGRPRLIRAGALRGNRWRHPDSIDDNPANLEAFRQWLAVSYADVEALRATTEAWGEKLLAWRGS